MFASNCLYHGADIFIDFSFRKKEDRYHKLINVISSATFGGYLIHDHAFVRIVLWENVFKNAAFADEIYLIPYSIFAIVLVFVVCTLLELIRIYVLEKKYIKFIDRMAFYIDGALDRIFVFTLGMKG